MLVPGKGAGLGIKSVQSATQGTDPENPALIQENTPHFIMAQAAGVRRVVAVMGKGLVLGLKPVQAPAQSSDPEYARAAFHYG